MIAMPAERLLQFNLPVTAERCYAKTAVLVEHWPDTRTRRQELFDGVWPQFQASIERRGLVPKGTWMVGVFPQGTPVRDIVASHIADQIEAAHREHPELAVVGVALIDSADVSGMG